MKIVFTVIYSAEVQYDKVSEWIRFNFICLALLIIDIVRKNSFTETWMQIYI